MNLAEFKNQAFTDFSQPERRDEMKRALQAVRGQLGQEYDMIVGGRRLKTDKKFHSINPSQRDEVIGVFQQGDSSIVEPAIEAADKAFRSWSRTPVEERVGYLLEVSRLMQKRRFELAAWMTFEVGKSWAEADGDVAEAIDFLEFYAREMLRLAAPQPLVRVPSESNELQYIPLGIGVIIPPWNFPLAILTGMTFAAIVAGNTTIVKPSSDAPCIAAQLAALAGEAGLPPGVLNFVTGGGPQLGSPLVVHPKTRFIAFTGSKAVGLHINEEAAKPRPGQIWIKRVVAEMGGKDSIIVAEDADLEAASEGVVRSAFGYQGQKCSACSRAIVVDSVYDDFLERLSQRTSVLIRQGDPWEEGVNFGPVINEKAQTKIRQYIETGRSEGRVLTGGEKGDSKGFFIPPTIIADIDPQAVISQEEIFGPVLAVIRTRDFDHALEIANNTEYGLTGAVYSSDPAKLDLAKKEFHVGNLYLNRGCTGALVGVHPFGGFNMSGTDSKAGGGDYLLLFTQAKSISTKI